jgi:NitT/TauT family transport system substrate-binding protein
MLNKKLWILLILPMMFFTLSSCKKDILTMIVPYGSPQFAQLYIQDSDDYDVTIVQGADPLVSAFASESYDIIIAPTNLGAKLYQSKPTYQLVASITWGNYYLISKETISIEHIEGKEIVAFGQSQTPDAILQYVLQDYQVDITYLDSLTSVVSDFTMDGSKIYLVAEPSLSVLQKNQQVHVLNVQDLYQNQTGRDSFPQASVFVNQKLSDSVVKSIKNDFEKSIEQVLNDTEAAALLAISLDINMEQDVIESALPNSNIIFKNSEDAKTDIIIYLEMLKAFNVNFTGAELPDNTFYR